MSIDGSAGAGEAPRLLDGMRVVSFCHYLQGPAAAQYLADMGADVIKVEPPGGAFERRWSGANTFVDGVSAFFLCANRNKRSIVVDLKRGGARAVVERLISRSDVLIENFRPGVMEKLGLGYADLAKIKPDLIYASATGFGRSGPMRDRPGQDLLVQARAGLVATTGGTAPTAVGCAAVDQHGAALLAMGILGAYIRKLATGTGTFIEASLLNAGLDLQTEALTVYMTGKADRSILRRDPHLATWFHEAPYGIYRIADGWLALSLNPPEKLARALGGEELAALAGCDAFAARDRFAEVVAAALADRHLEHLIPALDAEGIWYERVQDYDDLADDPQVRHNKVFRETEVISGTATLVNHPLRYDDGVPGLRHLALLPGQDTRAVLAELGFTISEIDDLVRAGAVQEPPSTREDAT